MVLVWSNQVLTKCGLNCFECTERGKSSKAIMWEYKSQKSCDHYHDVYNEAFVACIHRIAVEKDVAIT